MVTGLFAAANERESLRNYLTKLGEARDCYFTLETSDKSTNLVEAPPIQETEKQQISLDEIILRDLPDFKLTRYKDSNSYSLIDRKLLGVEGYSLNEKELPGSYQGTPEGLIDDLHRRHQSLSRQLTFIIGDIHGDGMTPLKFSHDEAPVRDVLTMGIPLKGYPRVIWVAFTKLGTPPRTVVAFH